MSNRQMLMIKKPCFQLSLFILIYSKCILAQGLNPRGIRSDSVVVDTFQTSNELLIGHDYYLSGKKFLRQTYHLNGKINAQFEHNKKKGEDKFWDSTGVLIHRCEKFYDLKN